MNPLDIKQS